jgi:hypothetical protein
MAFDSEAIDGTRGMTLLGPDGDLEIAWDSESEEKVRALIEKKMSEGVTFFVMQPIVGDVLHMRRKVTRASQLAKVSKVTIKDPDIDAMFSAGEIGLFRANGAEVNTGEAVRVRDAKGKLDHRAASKVAVKQRTVGVRALQGG